MAITGAILAITGRWLNRAGNHHALYALPLWIWGLLFVVLGMGVSGWVGFHVGAHGWRG